MKKKLISILAVICLLTTFASATFQGVIATPSASAVYVDGQQISFNAYTIDGNNYFKLRDIAYALSNTSKQFDLSWDAATNSINIVTGQPYTVATTAGATLTSGSKSATPITANVILNGSRLNARAYNIENSTFFRLRDLGEALNFNVGWENNAVSISTTAGFEPPVETAATVQTTTSLVEASKLNNYSSLKKKVSDEEFSKAYAAAAQVSSKYLGMSLEEQLKGIYTDLRYMSENELSYSMDSSHYSDVYGFFISKSASCAGATRAVGLCLNQLGIPYEHVHEGEYSHQWCRVNVNGTYWICDAYGMYVGPEPAPYQHPIL